MPSTTDLTNPAQHDAVLGAARKYVSGYHAGDAAKIREAFHPEAVMYGHSQGTLLSGPAIPQFEDFFAHHGASSHVIARLDVLAITPTAAVVRVDMENDVLGARYNDFLSLLKVDGEWRIISKVFHRLDD